MKRLKRHLRKYRGRSGIQRGSYIFKNFKEARKRWQAFPGKIKGQWLGIQNKRKDLKIYKFITKRADRKTWNLRLGFAFNKRYLRRHRNDQKRYKTYLKERIETWKKQRMDED